MLKACWHFSFTVSDLERSIAFYCDLLGMRLMHRQEQANEYTARLVGYEDASLKIAQLTIDGLPATRSGHLLELVEYVHPDCEPTDTAICRPGTAHLAFEVRDILDEYDRLAASGVRFKSPPNAITSGINQGGHTCYFLDPDDITLEMVEMPVCSG